MDLEGVAITATQQLQMEHEQRHWIRNAEEKKERIIGSNTYTEVCKDQSTIALPGANIVWFLSLILKTAHHLVLKFKRKGNSFSDIISFSTIPCTGKCLPQNNINQWDDEDMDDVERSVIGRFTVSPDDNEAADHRRKGGPSLGVFSLIFPVLQS